MSFVWSTAAKDLRRHRRDPLGLIIWIGLPIVIAGLIILASGGSGGIQPQAHLLVADEDDTFLSGFLVGALSQEAAGGLVRAEKVDQASGRARMADGDATALLVIPEGFSDGVLREKPVTMQLITNPSERILPAIIEEMLSMLSDAVFYLHRLIGEDLQRFADGPPDDASVFPDAVVGQFSVRINRMVERADRYLDPVVIRLETVIGDPEKEASKKKTEATIALSFLPGILFMSLLFMAQGLSEDLWKERSQKTLLRVVATPHPVASFLLGKVAGGCVIMAGVSLLAMIIGHWYFHLSPATVLPSVLWATFSGAVLMSIMMLLQVHAPSERGGSILTMVLIFPLMMLGGSFFPFEIMPPWMARVGRFTPNGWALDQLKRILLDEVDPTRLAVAFVGLLVVSGALFALVVRRLKQGFALG